MEKNKEYFQDLSMQMEQLLKKYKEQYPKNISAMIRTFFPVILLILSILLPFSLMLADMFQSLGWFAVISLVSPVLFVFSIILYFKNEKENKTDPTILPRINELRKQISPYADFSDVKKYLDQYNAQITQTDEKKLSYRKKFKKMVLLFFACFITFAVVLPTIVVLSKTHETNHSFNGLVEILGIEKDEPFLRLAPLKKEICENCYIMDDTLDFTLYERSGTRLYLRKINIKNAGLDDIFRLIITDKNGVPVAGCGKFVFNMQYDVQLDILSEVWCVEEANKYNTFKSVETARYMLENKDNLRVLVERIGRKEAQDTSDHQPAKMP